MGKAAKPSVLARFAPAPFALLALVWTAHLASTALGDPLGIHFDMGLWLTAPALKIPSFTGIFILLSQVHARAFGNARFSVRAGATWAAELVLVTTCAAMHAWAAYRFGETPFRSALFGIVASGLLFAAYVTVAPWILLDYDFFHGDILGSAVLFDSLFPLAGDPYTTLAIPAQAAAVLACVHLLAASPPQRARHSTT